MEPGSGRLSLLGMSLLVLAPPPATLSAVSLALGCVRDAAEERLVREVLELKGARCVVVEEGRW